MFGGNSNFDTRLFPGASSNFLDLSYCEDRELRIKMRKAMMGDLDFGPSEFEEPPDDNINLSEINDPSKGAPMVDLVDDYEDVTFPKPKYRMFSSEELFKTIPLVVVPRDEWGAVPSKSNTSMNEQINYIVVSFKSNTSACFNKEECMERMRNLQKQHMEEESLPDIPYNFFVSHDGIVYEGRGWDSKPSSSIKSYPLIRDGRIDIAYIGDYRTVIYPIVTHNSIMNLIQEGVDKGKVYTYFSYLEYREDLPEYDER